MTKIILVRHAITDAVGKRLSGRTAGVHLNKEGKVQAQKLAEHLKHLHITAVYSSPLERAVETAEPLSKLLNINTIYSEDFLEINYGEWTNCTIEELRSQKAFQDFNNFRSCTRIPGGESMPEAQGRIISGIEKICIHHRNETVATVSHSDLIKAAVAFYAGIHLDMFQRIEISPASISIVDIYEDTARILLLNYTGEIRL